MTLQCVLLNYNSLNVMRLNVIRLLEDGVRVVAVDNGSDDGSAEFLRGCRNVTSILNPENLGSSAGRNGGLAEIDISGDVLLLDSDVLYVRGSYCFLRELMASHHASNVGFEHDSATSVIEDLWEDPLFARAVVIAGTACYTHYGLFCPGFFLDLRFDEHYGTGWGFEDVDLYLEMLRRKMFSTAVKWRYYHQRRSSILNLTARGLNVRYRERQQLFCSKWQHTAEFQKFLLLQGLKRQYNTLGKPL